MSKIFSANFKRIIAFICFCVIFGASLFFFVFLSDKAEDNGDSEQSAQPQTESKYANAPTVIIDAGHGGEDGGAIGVNGVYEKDLNLEIALELEQMLSAMGINVRLTRDSDILLYDVNSDYEGHKKEQDFAARVAIAEEYGNAIFISIHMNSFSQSQYSGLQVYYSENSPFSVSLAQTVQELVAANLQPGNTRQIKPSNSNIYLLEKITHPAILVECGFISNVAECENLCSEEYRSRLCLVLCSAIAGYIDSNM